MVKHKLKDWDVKLKKQWNMEEVVALLREMIQRGLILDTLIFGIFRGVPM